MAVLPILTIDSSVLHKKARRVSSFEGSLQKLIDDMIDTMRDAGGVGLAAPQVGVSLRVVVIELPEAKEVITLINPEVVKRFGEREVGEGCLSLPGYRGEIKRSVKVVVKGFDRKGRPVRIRGDDLLAQAMEHELDHINGVVYVDHLESKDKLHRIEPEEENKGESEAVE